MVDQVLELMVLTENLEDDYIRFRSREMGWMDSLLERLLDHDEVAVVSAQCNGQIVASKTLKPVEQKQCSKECK